MEIKNFRMSISILFIERWKMLKGSIYYCCFFNDMRRLSIFSLI
jgi:hypothetical protein